MSRESHSFQPAPRWRGCIQYVASMFAVAMLATACGEVHTKAPDAGMDQPGFDGGDVIEDDAAIPDTCGDGVVDPGEECDDSNTVTETCEYGQASCTVCSASCTNVQGETLTCGDGETNGPETCDDGNDVTEACAYGETSCTVCTETCTSGPGISSLCGDGNQDPGEQCDDGNTTTEACAYGAASCTVCASNCQNGPGITSVCGDGATDGAHESCDDGNTTTEQCAYGQGSCTVCNNNCQVVAGETDTCGDGNTDTGFESCDDGNTTTEQCAYGQGSCTVCSSSCAQVSGETDVCGDGTRDIGFEDCDDGNTTTESCSYGQASCSVCSATCNSVTIQGAYCGDGTVNGPEQCEGTTASTCTGLGFAGGVVSCTSCTVNSSSCYANTPQITSAALHVIGFGNPTTRWPDGTWIVRTIYLGPNGNLLGNLSGSYTYGYTDVVPMLKLNVQHAPPSTAYSLRVYRSIQGDFTLGNLSWVGYADYSCNDGGSLAEYCTSGVDRRTPYLNHDHFSSPW